MFDTTEPATLIIDKAVRTGIDASDWLDFEFGTPNIVWIGRWPLFLFDVQRVLGFTRCLVTPFGLATIAMKPVRVVRVDQSTGRREVLGEFSPGSGNHLLQIPSR